MESSSATSVHTGKSARDLPRETFLLGVLQPCLAEKFYYAQSLELIGPQVLLIVFIFLEWFYLTIYLLPFIPAGYTERISSVIFYFYVLVFLFKDFFKVFL